MTDTPATSKEAHVTHVQSLFVEHLPALRGFVLSIVADFSLVDDVVQETFLVITNKCHEFERGSNFRAWAWKIARYKVLQVLDKKKRENERLSDEAIEALCAHETSERSGQDDLLQHLQHCLAELAPKAREVIECRYRMSHRPPEIARKMGWTVEAVHVALSRARTFLRQCVDRQTRLDTTP